MPKILWGLWLTSLVTQVFEQGQTFGGIWNYQDEVKHLGIWKTHRTGLKTSDAFNLTTDYSAKLAAKSLANTVIDAVYRLRTICWADVRSEGRFTAVCEYMYLVLELKLELTPPKFVGDVLYLGCV